MSGESPSMHCTVPQVTAHLLRSYGTTPAVWGGLLMTLASEVTNKVAVPISIASWITALTFDSQHALTWAVITALLFLLTVGCGYLGDHIFVRRSDARYKVLVYTFYDKVMRKDASFFREQKAGVLGAIFRDHLDGTINLFRLLRTGIVPLAAATIIPALVLVAFDYRLAVIFILAVAIRAYVSLYANTKIAPLRRASLQAYKELSGLVGDQMAHLSIVRASANYEKNKARIADLAAREGSAFWKRHRLSFQFDAASNMLVGLCFTLILFVLTFFSAHNNSSFEIAIITIIFVIQGMRAAQDAGDLLQRWFDHWDRTSSSLAIVGEARAKATKKSDRWPRGGRIDLNAVRFGYELAGSELRIFDRLDLSIPNGTHFAVIGENGAGKSTLVNLLMRFDSPQNGTISIDGCDIRELRAEALYRSIGFAPQDPKFFNETVMQNVMFFEPDAPPERVEKAFEITGMRELVSALPSGTETLVGETGQQLSGGERQLVAIARALLRDAPIYIFDEATSQVAADDARRIVTMIRRFLSDRTFMFVTHSRELQDLFTNVLEVGAGGAHWVGASPSDVLSLFSTSQDS